jgi:hypothetical protein
MSGTGFTAGIAALLTIMGALEIASMLQENNTADEAIHLMAGYSYLRERAFGINAEHPPLAKVLCALPALFLNPDLPRGYRDWETREGEPARRFLFENRVSAEVLLNSARVVAVALSLLLGLTIALWTRSHFGASPALLALALYCFDPNFIAHGRYVTTDVIASFTFFLACIAWNRYLDRPSRGRLIVAGLALGVAFVSKFSLLILPVVFTAMYLVKVRPILWRRLAASLGVMLLLASAVIYTAYAGEMIVPIHDPITAHYFNKTSEQLQADTTVPRSVLPFIDPAPHAGTWVHWAARHVPVPAFSYFKGLYRLYNHNYTGHAAYLLGKHALFGWWFYFPVAFLVKSTAALVALTTLTLAGFVRTRKNFWILLPAIIYFIFSIGSSINIGIRHILPIFPFLFISIAVWAMQARWRRHAAIVLLLVLVLETSSAYPNYLSFFNLAAGGSGAGPRYLADSNVDWGQDIEKLKAYMGQNAIPTVCLSYFGSADPAYYKIPHQDLPSFPPPDGCTVAAVSVNRLLSSDGRMKAFLGCKPRARVGYSIYIYDVLSCVPQTVSVRRFAP